MGTWVALLRAVNLGARNKVAMADLRALFESLGHGEVRTFLQSGNVLFTTTRRSGSVLEKQIESELSSQLGLGVTVLMRSARELGSVVAGNPFDGVPVRELHVAFLSAAPRVTSVDLTKYAPDEVSLGERVAYLHLPDGMQGSRLPNLEKLLGVRATVRTWNTVTRLHERAGGSGPSRARTRGRGARRALRP